ncbi:ABC transporter substrate-binding protein, partial [Streptococcus agalactiae]
SYTGYLLKLGVNVSSYSLDLEKDSPVFGKQLKEAKKLTADDTEAIAAQKPDLIMVFDQDPNINTLKKIAPTLVIKYGAQNYLDMMPALGKVFGKEKEANQWVSQWKTKTLAAKKDLHHILKPNTTFTIMDFYDKNIYLYGNNFGRGGELIYDSLGYAAPEKVKKDVFKKGWFTVSQEAIGDYVGDYALVNINKTTKKAASSLKESDVWKNLPAVKKGHIIESNYDVFYFSDPLSLEAQLKSFTKAIKENTN